ncbi:myoglobin, partial [Aplysia californica]|uniref:Globin n=1 Tax=Aplysia californica TaxID=6500 RepID=A0ABM0K8S5_APLCA
MFKKYPETKNYFPKFREIPNEELWENPKMLWHGANVLNFLGAVVRKLEKPDTLLVLVEKSAVSHRHKDVQAMDYDKFADVWPAMMNEVFGNKVPAHALSGWAKLLTLFTDTTKGMEATEGGMR